MRSARNAVLQRVLDVAAAEPTQRAVHLGTAAVARLRAASRRRLADALSACGVPTRVEQAQLREELARLDDATRALTEAVSRLESRVPPDDA